jgi:hypothetical protein
LDVEGRGVEGQFLRFLFLHGGAEGLPLNLNLPFPFEKAFLYGFLLVSLGGLRVGAMVLFILLPPLPLPPLLFTFLELQVSVTFLIHQIRLPTTLFLQMAMLGADFIAEADDGGVEGESVCLVATNDVILATGGDDEAEAVVLVHSGDALGNAAVGEVDDLLRLPLPSPSDPHQ